MIRILHLSDFHFQDKTAWDSQPILDKLLQALGELHQQRSVDAVVVTGDIVQSGKQVEYEAAKRWFEQLLKVLDLPKDRILFVPGNHDVDRGKVSHGAKAFQKEIFQANPLDQSLIAKVLAGGDDQEMLLKRFCDYQAFVNQFQPRALPWWHQILDLDGHRLGFGGLCSAWTSYDNHEQGKLLLGRYQVNQVLAGLGEAELKIALLHHPQEYIKTEDDGLKTLRQGFQLILNGHFHEHDVSQIDQSDRRFIRIAAGACYVDTSYPHSFHLIDLEVGLGKAQVTPWLWQDGRWFVDLNRGSVPLNLQRGQQVAPEQEPLEEALKRYRHAFRGTDNRWTLGQIGRAGVRDERLTTAPLEQMYQHLRLAEGYQQDETDRGTYLEAEDLLKRGRALVIRGIPGSGKTTWCRYTFQRLLEMENILPLFLELRKYASNCEDNRKDVLLDYLKEELVRSSPAFKNYPLVDFFEKGVGPRVVLLVDGWDEIGDYGDSLRKQLVVLQHTCPRLLVVATSRPFGRGRPSHSDGYETLDIQPLSDEEIGAIADRFFRLCSGNVFPAAQAHNEFKTNLAQAPGTMTLARTPLLLTMMLFVSRTQALPDKRHELYRLCIANLLIDLPDQKARKGVQVHHWRPDEGEARLRLVRTLAFRIQTSSGNMYKAVVVNRISLRNYLELPTDVQDSFIDWLVDRTGILADRNGDTVQFAHLSIQEYLVALYLKNSTDSAKLAELFNSYTGNSQWWETLRLWAALEYEEDPNRVEVMLEDSWIGDELWLIGAILADGAAPQGLMRRWLDEALPEICRYPEVIQKYAAVAWLNSHQKDQKRLLCQALNAYRNDLNWAEFFRLKEWAKRAGLKLERPPKSNWSRYYFGLLSKKIYFQEKDIAYGRAFCRIHPLWPDPHLAKFRLWPGKRLQVAQLLQLLVSFGNEKNVVKDMGYVLVDRILNKSNNVSDFLHEFAVRLAHDWCKDLDGFQFELCEEVFYGYNVKYLFNFALELVRDLSTGFEIVFPERMMPYIHEGFARNLAHDFARGIAKGYALDVHSRKHGLAKELVCGLTRYLFYDLNRYHIRWHSTCSQIWGKTFCGYLDLGKHILLGMFTGQRSHFSQRTPLDQEGIESLFKAACIVSLGDESMDDMLSDILRKCNDLDPVWPALARHVARRSTSEDRELLIKRAQYPESSADDLTRCGLQYYVRGDIMFHDGDVVTLDELFSNWGLKPVPLLEPFPPDVKIDWDAKSFFSGPPSR